ncbi:MAG: 6-carboxytetrahydropterin synthase QueD [Burkholderiaceae bacterium]|jgi:6-pyruvoyltetrahydropterin/6-carboxytetrahydropterin synthase
MHFRITRKIEFDAGHRIPDHKSKCRSVHGHRYIVEITLSGPLRQIAGQSDNGMVLDFGDVKSLAMQLVGEPWDHAFLAYRDDPVLPALQALPAQRIVVLDVIPTAENLAKTIFDILAPAYQNVFGAQLELQHVRLYETPNCWADVGTGGFS